MHKIKIIHSNIITDLTGITGGISLSTSLDTLGASFSFNIARNYFDSNFIVTEDIKTGDIIKFENSESKNLFTGVISDIEINRFSKSIKCFDFYFYLNKNKVIKQFKDLNASSCIEDLLKSVGAKLGIIEKIDTSITKIYKNKTVAEIICDILQMVSDETAKKYILEIEDSVFNLSLYKKIMVKIQNNNFGIPSVSESIVDMKNKILVVSNDQEDISISAEVKDLNSIKKYGMLQEIIEVDPSKDDISKVRNIADKKLLELNKVSTKASLEVLGNDQLRAGRILEVYIDEFNLNGNYLIKSCNHTFPKGNHKANLELEVV